MSSQGCTGEGPKCGGCGKPLAECSFWGGGAQTPDPTPSATPEALEELLGQNTLSQLRKLAEVQKQNAALQQHNTEQVELRRRAELELRQANECLDANRAEVSKLASLVNEYSARADRLQGELSEVLKRENLTKLDLADVLTWAKDMHDMARHGLVLLAGALGLYVSPVCPDPASLYAELFKLMAKSTAARVALHPLTKTAEKAKST